MLPARGLEDTLVLVDWPRRPTIAPRFFAGVGSLAFRTWRPRGRGFFIGGIDHSLRTGRRQFAGSYFQHCR